MSARIQQVRLAHTDLQVPDFSYYRKDETQDPTVKAKDTREGRHVVSYAMAVGKCLFDNNGLMKHSTTLDSFKVPESSRLTPRRRLFMIFSSPCLQPRTSWPCPRSK